MKTRKIFYRRKGKSIVIEGIKNKKKLLITTLPRDPIKLLEGLEKGSYFTREKQEKIAKKLMGLDFKQDKKGN